MADDSQCCDPAAADECRCACHDYGRNPPPARCSICHRQRTSMDTLDYSATQVIFGGQVGWYSGDDGEVCQECMVKFLTGQRYEQ